MPENDQEPDQDETGSADADGAAAPSASPVGQGDRVVEPGETLVSIAEETGHFWQTIWDDPANADLKAARGHANILLPGDRITIPKLRPKTVSCATGQVHRFRRRGVPTQVLFRVQAADGTPFPSRPYTLVVGSHTYAGSTDGDGRIEHFVVPSSRTGELTVDLGADHEPAYAQWTLQIGFLDPAASLAGAQGRLTSLGYHDGSEAGELGEATRAALARFQADQGLEPTGAADETTLERLKTAYGE